MRLIIAIILALVVGGAVLYETDPQFRSAVDGTADRAERGEFTDSPRFDTGEMEIQAAPRPDVDRFKNRGGAESRVGQPAAPRQPRW